MAKFKDALNREWNIALTLPDIGALRELGFDLNKAKKDASVFDSLADTDIFGRVFGYLCGEQIKAKNLTDEDFVKGFDGPAIFAAGDAILEAFLNFYHRPAVAQAMTKRLPAKIQEEEQRIINHIENSGSKNSDMNSPESPESTPPG